LILGNVVHLHKTGRTHRPCFAMHV
jgi:hypothetical protein